MFLRAGYRHKFKAVCEAVISVRGRAWRRKAYLLAWPNPDDRWADIAWAGAGGATWPEQVRIVSHPAFAGIRGGDRSLLPERA